MKTFSGVGGITLPQSYHVMVDWYLHVSEASCMLCGPRKGGGAINGDDRG